MKTMENLLKDIVFVQLGLFMTPLVLILWGWSLWFCFLVVYSSVTSGQITTSLHLILAVVLGLLAAVPLSIANYRFLKSVFKKYEMSQISVNVVVFLVICGFFALSLKDFFKYLPLPG